MSKPQGYRQAAAEECFFLLIVCLPYYQTLFLAGITGLLSFLLVTALLLFAVAGSPAICRTLATHLRTLPLSWVAPQLDRRSLWVAVPLFAVPDGPSLAPSFQRPPPLFS